jgi:hypothetical protein
MTDSKLKAGVNLNALRDMGKSVGFGRNRDSIGNYLWSPPQGASSIRVVPYIHQEENPFVRVYVYFSFLPDNKVPFLSPKTFGNPDPIADYGDYLRSSGDADNIKLANEHFTPTEKIYVPVLIRGSETQGIKFWSFSSYVLESIINQVDSLPEIGDFAHLANGRDINIFYQRSPYTLRAEFAKTPSSVYKDGTVLEWIKNCPNILEIQKSVSSTEAQELLEKKVQYFDPSKAFESSNNINSSFQEQPKKETPSTSQPFDSSSFEQLLKELK